MALYPTRRLIGLAFLTTVFNAALAGTNPTIAFSTYFGGTGFDAATSVAVDPAGNIYVTGWAASSDLPVTTAAIQGNNRGGVDAFVAKFNPTGSTLLYCTYLGGSGDDRGLSIAVDAAGSAYVTGATSSPDFPVTGQSRFRGARKAFVAKLSPAGDRLIYSTLLGGSGNDVANGIAVNSAGNAFVAGATYSTDFPTVLPIQSALAGQQDAFVAELDSTGASLLFSTYLGGKGDDSAAGIALDASGNVYVTGATGSPNFPVVGAIQSALGGSQDAFVAKLNPATHALVYSTYLGGSQGWSGYPQYGAAIDVDASGAAYATGTTNSSNFPVENAFQSTLDGFTNAFLAKLNAAGNALVYSTYLGGHSLDQGNAVRVNATGSACVAGATDSSDFPLSVPLQSALGGIWDAFVSCFTPAGNSLSFSTLLGGSGSDAANGLAVSGSSTYVVGQTQSMDFPLTGALQTWNGGAYGAFVATIQTSVPASQSITFGPLNNVSLGTAPFTVSATASSGLAVSFASTTSAVCTVSGATVTLAAVGTCAIQATQAGNAGYAAATPVTQSFQVTPESQTINFGVLSNQALGTAPFTVSATASSGLAVSFASPSPAVCTVSGATVTLVAVGTCTIQATQAGNADYAAATPVNQSFQCYIGSGLEFYPVSSCRIADTRSNGAKTGVYGPPSLAGGTSRTFAVTSAGCGIPSTAAAYSLNITAVPSGYLGYVTAWPTGQGVPIASTLNSWNGAVVSNAAIIPAGTGGSTSIFASNQTDILLDINGYFAPLQPSGLQFYPVTPCRIADTRSYGGKTGAFGPPSLAGAAARAFPVPTSSCSIPSSALAYSLNVTVVPSAYPVNLTAWPTGQPLPTGPTLYSSNGAVVAAAAIVAAGTSGSISLYASNPTDALFDINGYFAAPQPSGLQFYPVTPCRVADTRSSSGKTGAFGPPSIAAGSTRTLPVTSSPCGIPSNAQAFLLNLTVVPNGYLGFLTAWPAGQPFPVASNLNSWGGLVVANAAIVPAGTGGAINILASNLTDVIVDIFGYLAQ